MNWRLLLLPLLLAGCGRADPGQPPLAGARIGGPFALTDQNGAKRTEKDWAGKYRMMYFGYTFCPDVCPVDMAKLAAGHRAFAKEDPNRAARVVPIFVSVDPKRDTPQAVRAFVNAMGPGVVGLTASDQRTIEEVARAYGVAFTYEKPNETGQYLVAHSNVAYLMDPQNKPIALLPLDQKPEDIAAVLDTWVK